MTRLHRTHLHRAAAAFLLAALALAPRPAAQDLPGFGEGAWTWHTVGTQTRSASEILFDWDGELILFADEMYRLDDDTGTWTEFDGPRRGNSSAIALGRDTLIVGSAWKERSFDGGLTWNDDACIVDFENICHGAADGHSHGIYEVPAGRAFAGRLLTTARLYSDDRGASWQTAAVDAEETNWSFQAEAFASLPSGRVLMAGDWGVATSDDGGASWQLSPLWAPYGVVAYAVAEWATPGSRQAQAAGGAPAACGLAEAALCDGAVAVGFDTRDDLPEVAWWTNDGGRTWTVGSDLPQVVDGRGRSLVGILRELDRDGTEAGARTGLGRGLTSLGRGFVYATSDGGQSWRVVARVPFDGPGTVGGKAVFSAEVGPDGRLYAAVQHSTDHVYRTAEPAAAAFAYLTAGAGAPTEAAAPGAGVSVSVAPNPAGRGARIRVASRAPSPLTVELADVLGRRVALVAQAAAVQGARSWPLPPLPAGLYVARVSGPDGAVSAARFVVAAE